MPPFDRRARYPSEMQRISIPTLSGGVGRRAPTKRAINEAENLDNVLCTIEKSVEKRPPTYFVQRMVDSSFDELDSGQTFSTLDLPNTSNTADYWFYWYQISENQRYLVAIDYSLNHNDPSQANRDSLIRIYRTDKRGFYETLPVTVDQDMYEYFTYGNDQEGATSENTYEAITIGPQVLILNKRVKAGYTSDKLTISSAGESYIDTDGTVVSPSEDTDIWARVGYDGNFIRDGANRPYVDLKGRKLTYFTTVPVDTENEAEIYVTEKFYIKNDKVFVVIPQGQDMTPYGYDPLVHTELAAFMAGNLTNAAVSVVMTCIQEGVAEADEEEATGIPPGEDAAVTDGAQFVLRSSVDGGELSKFIPVEDWDYPLASKSYLGQNLDNFSEFSFPPRDGDTNDSAEGAPAATYQQLNKPPVLMEDKVSDTLASLYTDINPTGYGKIYNVENSYAGEPPGFYIVRSEEDKPYVRNIRTPFEYSVLDEIRFPKILKIEGFEDPAGRTQVERFKLEHMNLEERRSGTLQTNKGPSCFKEGLQAELTSLAFYRDRLIISSGDIVFTSRTGDFSDFWVTDPGFITDSDPIDVRLSTNKYAQVTSMTPFTQYLFINTDSDIQFTLAGSENIITPGNAVVQPTTFYSTSPLVNPVLLGSQIYFFAPRRAYIYFNDATVSVNQAVETSLNCPNYLPGDIGNVCVIPGYDTLSILDNDNPKFMYLYSNRYSGAEVIQNAFFRYIFDTDIEHQQSFDNDLYFVTSYQYVENNEVINRYYIEHMYYAENDVSIPLIDHQITVDESFGTYDANADTTTIVIPQYANLNCDSMYIKVNQDDPLSGSYYTLSSEGDGEVVLDVVNSNGTLTVTLSGNFLPNDPGYTREFTFGTSYTMTIELSPQYVRDENQNAIEGVFSIRSLQLQHFQTGTYRVEKIIRGRRTTSLTFTPNELDESLLTEGFEIPLPLYETRGESFSKIMGFGAETSILIVSDTPNPVNITQMELKGKFTGKSSGFVR